MRVLRDSILTVLLSLGVALFAAMHVWRAQLAAVMLRDMGGSSAPVDVYAGIPFVIHDGYATQLCISSHSGRPLPSFVVPVAASRSSSLHAAPARVQAGMPFVVHDGWSTLLCVSTRSGESLVPFIVPCRAGGIRIVNDTALTSTLSESRRVAHEVSETVDKSAGLAASFARNWLRRRRTDGTIRVGVAWGHRCTWPGPPRQVLGSRSGTWRQMVW
jgi:hypothetical protein